MSLSGRARGFFDQLAKKQVTLVIDTRLSPSYQGAGWTDGKDLPFFCKCFGVRYLHMPLFAPTKEMRDEIAARFTDASPTDRDPRAWTKFLEQYESLMIERKPTRSKEFQEILNGPDQAIAILCACPHHDDCHRSYTCGMIVASYRDLSLGVLYADNKVPLPKSPRRYRLKDFPLAGLRANPRGGK